MVVRYLALFEKVLETEVHQTAKDISTYHVIDSTLNLQKRSHMTKDSVFSKIKIHVLIIYKKLILILKL